MRLNLILRFLGGLSLLLLVGCKDEIIDIEESNNFHWQKNMSEQEFKDIEEGMTYLEVVKIARGAGEKITDDKYVWDDEIKLTQAYELRFEDDQLVSKHILEKKGNSNRQ